MLLFFNFIVKHLVGPFFFQVSKPNWLGLKSLRGSLSAAPFPTPKAREAYPNYQRLPRGVQLVLSSS